MPTTRIRGANLHYSIVGSEGPWIVLTPGGRAPGENVRQIAERLSQDGYRILLHDRRNCGASDVIIEGNESEQEIWADDLYVLLDSLDALPVIAGGGSAGCRLSLLMSLRHPGSTRGLLLWWVTGGKTAATRLGHSYYGQFIDAAMKGGMKTVCETEFFAERIAQNPSNKDRLLAMQTNNFIEVMCRWREFFLAGAALPVIGATADQLGTIDIPACIIPGNDDVHPLQVGRGLHDLLPGSELHELSRPEVSPTDNFEAVRGNIGEIFADFLKRHQFARC